MPDEKLARALRARIRRKILKLIIEHGKMSVHQIAEELKVTEYTASRHLKLLYDLGILEYEMKPPEKFYYVRIPEIEELLEVYDRVVSVLAEKG